MSVHSLEFDGKILRILDQRYLPFKVLYENCRNEKDVYKAIKYMKIRGAPAIGVAAAYGMYLGIKNFLGDKESLFEKLKILKEFLDSARPTAVNLHYATERVLKAAYSDKNLDVQGIIEKVKNEAITLEKEDASRNLLIGKFGSELIREGDTILTICNTGELATVKHGTAFSVIKTSFEKNKKISVIALETRPYLQGARLTAFELKESAIPFKLITDNMSGYVMANKLVNIVLTGADRIARNGDTANKIGTYMLAVLANYHKIPFYVVAPITTIDLNIKSGKEIPIEERSPDEVTHCMGKRIAPFGIDALNPSFDITPNKLITGIITDKGVLYPPFEESIKKAFASL